MTGSTPPMGRTLMWPGLGLKWHGLAWPGMGLAWLGLAWVLAWPSHAKLKTGQMFGSWLCVLGSCVPYVPSVPCGVPGSTFQVPASGFQVHGPTCRRQAPFRGGGLSDSGSHFLRKSSNVIIFDNVWELARYTEADEDGEPDEPDPSTLRHSGQLWPEVLHM